METSELKEIWQKMDERLSRQSAIALSLLHEKKIGNARAHLRPLFWGMAGQMVFGLASVVVAAPFWIRHLDTPLLWISGLSVHVYGVLAMVLAGYIMRKIDRLDVSLPVVEIQKQFVALKKKHIQCGWIIGTPWWLLWLPYSVIFSHERFDLLAGNISYPLVLIMLACSVFMLLTVVGVIWAQNSKRPGLAARTEAMLAGASLVKAQQSLDELVRFEQEEPMSS